MSDIDLTTLWISLKTAVSATALSFIFGLAAAVFMIHTGPKLSRRWRLGLDTLFIAPLILPPTVLGFILLVLLGAQSPFGRWLTELLGQPLVFTWPAAVIAATGVAFPLMYRTSRAALQQLDPHLAAAARSLGASELRIYLKIIIPSAWPGLIAGTMLAFARSLGEFGASLMLAGSIPGETRTVPMSIYFAVEAGDWQAATFWSICIVLISVAAIFLAEYWLEPLPQPEQRSIQNIGTQKICPVPRSNAALQLELYRNYSNFSLQLQFTSDSTRIAVLGASGSGKSLLLQCMAGLIQADEGKLFWNNRTWFDRQQNIRVSPQQRHVGLVLQDYALFPKLSLIDNISFGIKGLKKAEKRALAMAWLEKFGLTELADRKPSEISGGQRQRIALARALACKPEFLLLDEPFSALDTHIRSQLEQSLMRELHDFPGRLLLVTHSIDEAFRFCDEIIVLDAGKIVRHGPKKLVLDHPLYNSVARLTGCKNISPAQRINACEVEIPAWSCRLELAPTDDCQDFDSIGIRAHHLQLSVTPIHSSNNFPCWLVESLETPHRVTWLLNLQHPPNNARDFHLQIELLEGQAEDLRKNPQPWILHLPPHRLLRLREC